MNTPLLSPAEGRAVLQAQAGKSKRRNLASAPSKVASTPRTPPEPSEGQEGPQIEEIRGVVLQEATSLYRQQITGRFRFVVVGPAHLKDSTRVALVAALNQNKS